jgi:putative membrane protein
MSRPLRMFLQRWLINTVAVLVAANVIRGIEAENVGSLLVASLLLGILNALVRPLLLLLSLPLVLFTLGLFTLVINALLLMLVGQVVISFHVDGFWPAFWGGLVISIIALILNTLTGTGEHRIELRRGRSGPPGRGGGGGGGGGGPVIDI